MEAPKCCENCDREEYLYRHFWLDYWEWLCASCKSRAEFEEEWWEFLD